MARLALRSAVHHSDDPHLLWYVVLVMVCSVGWLFYTVFWALR